MIGTKQAFKMANMIYWTNFRLITAPQDTKKITYRLPADILESRWDNHDHHEAEQPVGSARHGISLRAAPQRCNLGAVQKRPPNPGKAKEGIKKKQKPRGGKFAGARVRALKPSDDGKATGHADCSPQKGSTAPKAFYEQHG